MTPMYFARDTSEADRFLGWIEPNVIGSITPSLDDHNHGRIEFTHNMNDMYTWINWLSEAILTGEISMSDDYAFVIDDIVVWEVDLSSGRQVSPLV